jgi:hypothetical protein
VTHRLEGHKVRDPGELGAKLETQLAQAAAEVSRRCGDTFSQAEVRTAVDEAYHHLADTARVTPFLPVLAARRAQRALHA